ncbi:MAG: hypothetical protein GY856_30225, partial [bacterium]|nr:hypothetical protein [bacterium]
MRPATRRALPAAAAVLLLLVWGCVSDQEPEIAAGIDGCASCGMVIDKENQAAGYYVDKEFHTFCSSGCLLESYEKRRQQGQPSPERIFFADYLGSGLHPAESVTYLLTEHVPTVMDWGILAFADPAAARAQKQHDDESLVDWIGLRTRRGKPDRRLSLVFTGEGMSPEVVELQKGELVEWEIRGRELDRDLGVK